MSEVKTTLLSVLHSMLTSRSQIWYTIFVGPPAFAGAAADKLRHCILSFCLFRVAD